MFGWKNLWKLKLKNFKEVFQITKIVEYEIHLKKNELENFQIVELLIT